MSRKDIKGAPTASCWSFLIRLSSDSMNVKTTLIWKHIKYLYLFWLYEFKVKIKCRTEFMTQIWAEKHETQSCRPHRSFMSTNKVSINFWQQQLISLFPFTSIIHHAAIVHHDPGYTLNLSLSLLSVTVQIFPSWLVWFVCLFTDLTDSQLYVFCSGTLNLSAQSYYI